MKYKSKKIIIDGITFDSKKEGARYLQLRELEKKGLIKNLELQKTFELLPPQREKSTMTKNGKEKQGKTLERAVNYIADFVYINELGEVVVEDVKGYKNGGAYQVFTIKRKLMLYVYGVKVKEI